jgi:transposase
VRCSTGGNEAIARQDVGYDWLMSVPGIRPIISSAMVTAIGTGDAFAKGRDFTAWLGLVAKQISTGDRTIPGKISKRGDAICAYCSFKPRGGAGQTKELGARRAQALAQGGKEAAALQCAGSRTRQ